MFMKFWHYSRKVTNGFLLVQTKRILLVLLIMLNVASSANSSEIVKSPIDEKSYRYLQLDNKLRVMCG